MTSSRARLVIDPVWRLIDESNFATVFGRLEEEARHCGFLGLDLEWTTIVQTVEEACEEDRGIGKTRRGRPKRTVGPVAVVQLSSLSTTVIVKYCDLVGLHQGAPTDPLLPCSRDWPHHRLGVDGNSASIVRRVLQGVNGLLADTTVAKVGVGILGDKEKMEADYGTDNVSVAACVDLVVLAEHYLAGQEVTPHNLTDPVPVQNIRSLKAMCDAFAGRTLDKDPFVVCSAWGSGLGALSPLQIQYAAADAEASFDACAGILKLAGLTAPATSSSPSSSSCWEFLAPLVGKDVPHARQQNKNPRQSPQPTTRAHHNNNNTTTTIMATTSDTSAAAEAEEDWCKGRDKPYYDNINVFDPDMNLVFTVDKSKAEWYVYKKKLATVIEWRAADTTAAGGEGAAAGAPVDADTEDTTKEIASIQLCFAPDFRKYNDAHIRRNLDYFKQPKENACVICGSGGNLVRFAVVPLMYRKYFPSVYMSHNSYDLLLLCTGCFAKSRAVYEAEKAAIAADFGIPIGHLTPKAAPLYDARIAQKEASLKADTAKFYNDNNGNDTVAHHLPPVHILRAMQEYRELQRHRELIIAIFKYAKALRQHYAFGEPCGAPDAAQVAPARRSGGRRSRKQFVRSTAVDTSRATQLPEARLKELCDYIDAHAPTYPFYEPSASSQAEQDTVFAEAGPSSKEGVELIMTGRPLRCRSPQCPLAESSPSAEKVDNTPDQTEEREGEEDGEENGGAAVTVITERSYHSVLTQYWVMQHPELLAFLPTTTREEERRRDHGDGEGNDTDDEGGDGEMDRVPYVDNHGFLVVKMLMQKYASDSSSGKNSEHAVGQFIYRWRTAFVSRLHPQHLPIGWVPEDGILM